MLLLLSPVCWYVYRQLQATHTHTHCEHCKSGIWKKKKKEKKTFWGVKSQCCSVLVFITTVKLREEDRLVAQPAAAVAQWFTGLPVRTTPPNVIRRLRAVKWTPDEENELLVDVWCVPVDFTAGFFSIGISICLLFYARLRTRQRTMSLRFCVAEMFICSGRYENLQCFYALRNNDGFVLCCEVMWYVYCFMPLSLVCQVELEFVIK